MKRTRFRTLFLTTTSELQAEHTTHIFIIDTKGNVVYKGTPMGKITGSGDYISYVDKALEELTAGIEVATKATKPYGCTVKYKN